MLFQIQHGLFKFEIVDYYAILGVPLDAQPKQIRKRYLQIARILHPDTCPSKEDKGGKELATEILSKLVNPAYEHLSKEKSRKEFNLVLSQMSKHLAKEGGKITIASDSAKDLFKAGSKLTFVYSKELCSLAEAQYKIFDKNAVGQKIAQISELNLVYLILKKNKPGPPPPPPPPPPIGGLKGKNTPEPPKQTDPLVSRVQEYMKNKNFAKAILELREGLKYKPNSSTYHSLLGLAYLKQHQISMAKVHINKAHASNPKNPIVIESKKQLDKLLPPDKRTSSSGNSETSSPSKIGKIFTLFRNQKK